MRHLINRIRYRWWQLNCPRSEWYQRCWTALADKGYATGSDADGDAAMYRYWYENIRTTPPTKETPPCGS